MKGIKNFVLGFSLSLFSMSLSGQLYTSATKNPTIQNTTNIKIDLFKNKVSNINLTPQTLFTDIKKSSTPTVDIKQDFNITFSQIDADDTINSATDSVDIAYTSDDINGIDDDEILAIASDNIIPIEFNNTLNTTNNATISNSANDDMVAMLPSSPDTNISESPWVIVKGSKNIKNKKLLEDYAKAEPLPLIDNFQKDTSLDAEVSYQVAEKIKQSIIFPIPEEILNDENLTPTFIKNTTKTNKSNKKAPQKVSKNNNNLKPAAKPQNSQTEQSKGILNSISSWFTETDSQTKTNKKQVKAPPAYNSQEHTFTGTPSSSSDDLVSFYETMQEAQEDYKNHNIIPSELKLSFQPDRAEISGQTLRWLKAFSEATKDKKTYLQIRLDASAPTELQKKRLNLLYTIFINNGVDFQKVDTVFTLTEPNTFIIRTLDIK